MKSTRHPHPHIDPRQPRQGAKPGTNPPVFVWKPPEAAATGTAGTPSFGLRVARDAAFREICLQREGLSEPLFLPEKAFAPGTYYWRWSSDTAAEAPEVFTFEITPQAVRLEVPPAAEWLERLPKEHPRIYIRPEEVAALRASREGERKGAWAHLEAVAGELLAQPHEIEEPPFLPDRRKSYRAFFDVWYRVMMDSRRFVRGAETLALAYLASGEERYARAACRRMVSISRWDPDGSSHIAHNDEAHMSVLWHGTQACDWVWERFTDEERARVIEQFRRRGRITYEQMHGRGSYGVTRFNSHAGREIIFLAQIALVFHEQIPEAAEWLAWLRPVLCGIWPIWAGDDGAWAEGPSYGLAYVGIMTMFATALKHGAGVNLYRRPFWKGHARWRLHCWPPYAEWMGFGDHSERWGGTWRRNAELVEIIARQSGSSAFDAYVEAFRKEAQNCPTPAEREMPAVEAQCYLAPGRAPETAPAPEPRGKVLRIFPAAGWAAFRTDLEEADDDVALLFRSSPYGAVSHSHANQNDFILHAGGKVLAMPSGYYDGYGSDHHAHWVWHTRSHNCVTLSEAGQLMRSHDSRGAIENAFEDERLAYFRGNADAAYRDRADRCRRHVFFLKPHSCFVLLDEFAAAEGVASALQWNIHSWSRFEVNEEPRSFRLQRGGRSLQGHFLYHANAFFTLTEGWDPPPFRSKPDAQWHNQHHLRFTTSGFSARRHLGVVLCPGHAALRPPKVETGQEGEAEIARIGEDLVMVNQGKTISHAQHTSGALALLCVQGQVYEVDDGGIRRL